MTTPEPRVPIYIDANARHQPRTMRMLAFMALAGREGVLGSDHLAVRARTAPNGQIRVAPGAWGALNTAIGGAYEAYVDKFTQEIIRDVNPTDAVGRTDLVVCRVKNPYLEGTGQSWPIPQDAENGPYWDIDVIHGVPANTTSVKAYNPAYTAITLARIQRPANTTIIQQSHIVDLRSLVDLSGERLIIVDNPPATPPPIAQAQWTESTPVGNNAELKASDTAWTDFPAGISWKVPIPSWAVGVDVLALLNPALTSGDFIGDLRVVFAGDTAGSVPANVNENLDGRIRYRTTLMVGGTEILDPGIRGKEVTVKIQGRSTAPNLSGRLIAQPGTRIHLDFNFKKYPITTDGA